MIDVMDFIAAIEDARTPTPVLSPVDAAFLAEAEEKMKAADVLYRGYCRFCGAPIPSLTGSCDPCRRIERISNIRKSRELGHVCIHCGTVIDKGKGSFLCDPCKKVRHKAQQAEHSAARSKLRKVVA